MLNEVPPLGEDNYPEGVPINSISSSHERKYIFWASYIDHIVGKVLTQIDASVIDQRQNKALKDVLRQTIYDWAAETSYCENCENGKKLGGLPKAKHPYNTGSTKEEEQLHCPVCNMYYFKK